MRGPVVCSASLLFLILSVGVLAEEKLSPAKVGKVARLHVLGEIYLAGQPSAADLKAFKEKGVKTVINLRPKAEMAWDEDAAVRELGMEYISLPFAAPAALTDDLFDKARKVLADKGKKPILLHCASANRVGAIWLAHRVLDHDVSYEKARAEATQAGLRSRGFEEKAREYIRKKQAKK